MIAFSIALVICVALICGTVLRLAAHAERIIECRVGSAAPRIPGGLVLQLERLVTLAELRWTPKNTPATAPVPAGSVQIPEDIAIWIGSWNEQVTRSQVAESCLRVYRAHYREYDTEEARWARVRRELEITDLATAEATIDATS